MASALASLHEPSQQALLNATWQQVIQGHQQAVANLAALARHENAPTVAHLIAVTRHDLAGYTAYTRQVGSAIKGGQTRQAIWIMSVENASISNKTQADFDALGAVLTHQAGVVRAQADSTVNQSLLWLILIAVLAIPIAGAVIWWIVRSITRPLAGVTESAQRVAQGHVDVDIDVHGDDEIGRVAEAFRSSVSHLQEMAHAAHEIAAGNLAVEVQPKSDGDALGQAFLEMSTTLREALGDQSCLEQLTAQMTRLDECLGGLEHGLSSMTDGDMTVAVSTDLDPIVSADGGHIGHLAELFNSMLARARSSLEGYNEMRETLREALGDQSSLEALTVKLESLNSNCLTNLERGLTAMRDGDLTQSVIPETDRIGGRHGTEIGHLARVFNEMLGRAQSSMESYNEMRETLRDALGDQSSLEALTDRLESLKDNDLASLQSALAAMDRGDLTVVAEGQTRRISSQGARRIGHLAGVFNGMLESAEASVAAYNHSRQKLVEMLQAIRRDTETVAVASQQMATSSDEAGQAISEIAQAVQAGRKRGGATDPLGGRGPAPHLRDGLGVRQFSRRRPRDGTVGRTGARARAPRRRGGRGDHHVDGSRSRKQRRGE